MWSVTFLEHIGDVPPLAAHSDLTGYSATIAVAEVRQADPRSAQKIKKWPSDEVFERHVYCLWRLEYQASDPSWRFPTSTADCSQTCLSGVMLYCSYTIERCQTDLLGTGTPKHESKHWRQHYERRTLRLFHQQARTSLCCEIVAPLACQKAVLLGLDTL